MAIQPKTEERKLMAQPARRVKGLGMWAWLAQRVSGLLLVLFIFLHIFIIHFGARGGEITFDSVMDRLSSPVYTVLEIGLLATVLYHAFNGLWVIILDLGIDSKKAAVIYWVLFAVAFAMFILGTYTMYLFKLV